MLLLAYNEPVTLPFEQRKQYIIVFLFYFCLVYYLASSYDCMTCDLINLLFLTIILLPKIIFIISTTKTTLSCENSISVIVVLRHSALILYYYSSISTNFHSVNIHVFTAIYSLG